MKPESQNPLDAAISQEENLRPWCSECDTDQYILIEAIDDFLDSAGPSVGVAYSCLECDSFFAHDVRKESLSARVLHEFLCERSVEED